MKKETDEQALDKLRTRLSHWFEVNARSLPWRETNNAYYIWLSEVILQQTQVVQGMGYYHRFIEAYPTLEKLAQASEDEVLRLWQGLGYYSRGRNLLKAARLMSERHEGAVPRTMEEIKRLPGIGSYTSAAVLSFAYNLPYAAVDGNVYRVLSRLDASTEAIDTPRGQKYFQARADELLDRQNPGKHNQAMIELGAIVCKPRQPDCSRCPLTAYCLACAEGNPELYPKKQGKIKLSHRYLNYFLVRLPKDEMLIRRRDGKGIWQGLYELPLIEGTEAIPLDRLLFAKEWQELASQLLRPKLHSLPLAEVEHRLTHRLLHATLYLIEAEGYVPEREEEGYLCISRSALADYGIPVLISKLLNQAEGGESLLFTQSI